MTTEPRNQGGNPSLFRLILVFIFCLLVCIGALVWKRQDNQALACRENLVRIYGALRQYDAQHGHLPEMAFFPDDANDSVDSLLVILRDHGVEESDCVCPALPESLRRFGVNYLWNATLNRYRLQDLSPSTWLLVEINALRPGLPSPHRGTYQVLYADGQVVLSRTPPPGL